jgi:flagellar biosynthesis/type III secretory pathway M-ring protein FliF/YscJ
MAVLDPGIRRADRLGDLLRRGTRFAVVGVYLVAFIVAIALIKPAFHDVRTPAAPPRPLQVHTDVLRKGETVATFAARHGLELGDLLALNPGIDSLSLPAGTKLRVG